MRAAVQELVAEAEALLASHEPPKGKPDYASRCSQTLTPEEVGETIVQRTHRDAFIDAYVRWQLTSFDPPLPAMDDRAFAKFMDAAPKRIDNPRAEANVVEYFERIESAGKLPPRELERCRASVIELEKRTKLAELMNRPADEFFDFISEKLGPTGVQPRLWLLAECAGTVSAGWSTRSVKMRISKSFAAAATETDFTGEHKRLIEVQARKLVELERRYVNEVTLLAGGSVNVTFSTVRVTSNDVDKWVNRLMGIP